MPELPEVEAVRRRLEPHLTGTRIVRLELRRANLRTPFPSRFRERVEGQTVRSLTRKAKYLLAQLSSGEILVMHLGMSGAFRIGDRAGVGVDAYDGEPSTADHHDHVVFRLSSGAVITFNDPRRFGLMQLLPAADLARHPALGRLGVEPLSPEFDAAALARACAGKKVAIKAALLDQRVVAGVGNIYACEALHLAGLSPFKRASTLATRRGAPREPARRLAVALERVLTRALARDAGTTASASPFRVYGREGMRCPRRGCDGLIKRRTQTGRSTFYCPACQH